VECRSGGATGDYTLVLTFANAVTVGNVTMSSGTGRVVNAHPAGGTTITVNLTDVSDAQRLTVTLSGLSNGSSTGDLVVPMQVLVGDVTGNGSVNATDVNSVSAFSGQPLAQTNFRNDVNVSGSINATDVAVVQAASGGVLPAAGPSDLTADVSYGYDNDGKTNRLSVGGTDYDFSFGYDGMGRFETISLNPYGGYQYQYYYDKASNVLERRNNLTLTSQFSVPDELNRLKERIMEAKRFPAGQPAELYNFSYEKYGYDKMSRLSTVTRVEDGRRDVYGYNAAGELTSANYGLVLSGGVYVNPLRQVTYGLDNAGNRTGVTDTVNGGTAFMPNNLNQYTQTGNGTQHEVTAYTNGIETVSYAYLGDGPLAAVSSASQGNYALGYDALGRCVRRKTNGQTTYYAFAGGGAILELDAATTGLQQAILGNTLFGLGPDEIIARNNGGTPQFFMQDWQGSTRAVTDITGKLLEQYRYDAFGAPTIKNPSGALLSTSMINNRFLFTGREWVQRYGFYEYRARAYHPKLGRFMSEDPLGFAAGDINLFRYTGNDPVNRTDPTGLVTSDSDKEDDDIQPGAPATSYTNGWGEYRPTGSNIPRSATATSNGNGLDISFHDAVNGTHELGSFGFVNGDLVSAPSGVNSDGTPILRAGAVNQGGAGIGDFIGKIWALPNTILGTVIGLASLPFGGHFLPPANNAIQISLPWGDRPLTLGNVQLYGGNTVPSQETSRYDEGPGAVVYGSHEEAHTYQYQVLGPLFLPIYLLSGGIHSQPFENAADNYAQGIGSWWPGQ
jgi:RHS repeat-associated protein